MQTSNRQISLLSEAEKSALYYLPDFDKTQRLEYLTMTDQELNIALSRKNVSAKIHCILQIGYFKAVQMFYRLTWNQVNSEDLNFIIQQYFPEQQVELSGISKHEYYTQSKLITELFGYKLWQKTDESSLYSCASQSLSRDTNPQFITLELISYLQTQKIIRPGYTTLQTIVSTVINTERKRLDNLITNHLMEQDKGLLQSLLIESDTLSKLAAIKQDAKDFKQRMMVEERKKLETMESIFLISKRLIPVLCLSQQNIYYYASLVNYYSIHELRERLKIEQTYLYLICYVWKRYQQINDNLVNAFCYQFKKIDEKVRESARDKFSKHVMSQREELNTMKRLAGLYVDDTLTDEISFGFVRQKAFSILSREQLISKVSNSTNQSPQEVDFYWDAVDDFKHKAKSHLRHLVTALTFSSKNPSSNLIQVIDWIKTGFKSKDSHLKQINAIPNNLVKYLVIKGK